MVDVKTSKGTIKRTRLQTDVLSKENFAIICKYEFNLLRAHIARYRRQYDQVALLKENLPVNAATLQIDYSENYLCSYQDEPSALYFDKHQVTLHPMVAHFKGEEGTLKHQSYVGVTAESNHAAPTTLAFLKKVVQEIKTILPIEQLHIISDSPASQYRNRSMVKVVAESEKCLGVKTS